MIFICLLLALFGFSVWLTSDGVLRKFGRDLTFYSLAMLAIWLLVR